MLRLALLNVLERRALFAGSILTVAIGVALVQSSLLLLLAAAGAPAPGGSVIAQLTFEELRVVSVTVLGTTLGVAAFLAVFIIASTFAFSVDQRRRDLALLRLAGGSRRQVRTLLIGEALVLGAVGAAIGIPAGIGVQRLQVSMLEARGLVPAGLQVPWHPWVLGASLGTGVLLATAGVLLAARRAARVRPLEALRGEESDAPAMTVGRWVIGGLAALGTLALLVLAPVGGAAGGQAMTMSTSIVAVIAFAALAPAVVPFAARWAPVGRGPLGRLARATVRHDVRRSASTAAPVIVLIGLVAGQAVALLSFSAVGAAENRRDTVADLVVTSTAPLPSDPAATTGVRTASTELVVPAEFTVGPEDLPLTEVRRVALVEPGAYAATHRGGAAALELRDGVAVAGPGALGTGGEVRLRVAGVDLGTVPVVAAVPEGLAGGPALLLPADAVPPQALEGATATTYVVLDEGADAAAVRQALQPLGTVQTHGEWAGTSAAASTGTSTDILVVVLGLGALYALLAVVNAAVIGTSARTVEFASARATGVTRRQVIGMALLEGAVITSVGTVLGLLASAGSVIGVLGTSGAVTGRPVVDVPWVLLAALVAVAVATAALATGSAAWAATRQAPVTLLRARE